MLYLHLSLNLRVATKYIDVSIAFLRGVDTNNEILNLLRFKTWKETPNAEWAYQDKSKNIKNFINSSILWSDAKQFRFRAAIWNKIYVGIPSSVATPLISSLFTMLALHPIHTHVWKWWKFIVLQELKKWLICLRNVCDSCGVFLLHNASSIPWIFKPVINTSPWGLGPLCTLLINFVEQSLASFW